MSTGEQLLLSGSTNTSDEIVAVENYLVGKIIYACPKRTYISMDVCCFSNTDLTPWRYLLDDTKPQEIIE